MPLSCTSSQGTSRPGIHRAACGACASLPFAAIFILAVALNVRHNGFPVGYHPDEPTKARQIASGQYQFLHPMLLLNATRLVHLVGAFDETQAGWVRAGRTTSALLAAGAAALAMAAVWFLRGERAATAAGLAIALCPMLAALAHYMKEDTALVFGLAALFATLAWGWRRNYDALSWAAAGCAAGLAMSGKYAGAAALPIALGVLCARRFSLGRAGIFAGALLATLALVNYQALMHPARALAGLRSEAAHAATGHEGIRIRNNGLYVAGVLGREVMLPVWALAAWGAASALRRWRALSGVARAGLIALPAYLGLVYFSRIQNPRYLLPVVAGLHALAGLGAIGLIEAGETRGRRWIVATGWAVCVVVAVLLGARTLHYLGQFRDDSRRALARWAVQALSPDDVVVAESYCALPETVQPLDADRPVRIYRLNFAAEVGSMLEARRYGITHFTVCDLAYRRYIDENRYPTPQEAAEYAARRRFYAQLFTTGRLVWHRAPPSPMPGPTNPEIRVYRIDDACGERIEGKP